VTILEGRNRVGGRLHQERLANGHFVDMGPNWIHGTSDNPMLDLAKETSTTIGSWDTRSYIFDEFGELFPLQECEQYSEMMWEIVLEAFKHSNEHSTDIPHGESLLEFFERRVSEKMPAADEGSKRKQRIILQMSECWGAFIGSPIHRQSLKFFWLEECLEGGVCSFSPISSPTCALL